jgi:cyclopropane-fatty-acyl-phospholipid synthase
MRLGSFAKYAAEKYGVSVTGVKVSKEQVELGSSLCAGMPIDIRLQDYRDIQGTFDRVVSLGMAVLSGTVSATARWRSAAPGRRRSPRPTR